MLRFESLESRRVLAAAADVILDFYGGVGHGDPVIHGTRGDEVILTAKSADGWAVWSTDGQVTSRLTDPVTVRPDVLVRDDSIIVRLSDQVYSIDVENTLTLVSDRPGARFDAGTVYWLDTRIEQHPDARNFIATYDDLDGRHWEGLNSTYCETPPGDPLYCNEPQYEYPSILGTHGGDVLVTLGYIGNIWYASGAQDMWIDSGIDSSAQIKPRGDADFLAESHLGIHDSSGALILPGATLGLASDDGATLYYVVGQEIWTYVDGTSELLYDGANLEFPATFSSWGFSGDGYVLAVLHDEIYDYAIWQIDTNGAQRVSDDNRLYTFGRVGDDLLTSAGLWDGQAFRPTGITATKVYPVPGGFLYAERDSVETGRELTVRRMLPGDSNLDGAFNSDDLLLLFQYGEYEDELVGNSGWATGDWNGDGEFDSSDLIEALTLGWYES